MSKTQGRQQASDPRRARRSMVELTAVATRAIEEALQVASSHLAEPAPANPPQLTHATAKLSLAEVPEQPAGPIRAAAAPNKPASPGTELADTDSAAEMVVKIAKDCQNAMLKNIRAGLNAALDHAKDFAEKQPAGDGAGRVGGSNDGLIAFGAAGAAFRDTALELMKANVLASVAYAQDLAEARTAAEVAALSGTHGRKSCELMLKQADALKTLAQAVAKERDRE